MQRFPNDLPEADTAAQSADDALIERAAELNRQALSIALEANAKAQRLAAYMKLPIIPNTVVAEILHLPLSVYYQQKRTGDTPVMFSIGRRDYSTPKHVVRYIDHKAETEGSVGNRRTRRKQADTIA